MSAGYTLSPLMFPESFEQWHCSVERGEIKGLCSWSIPLVRVATQWVNLDLSSVSSFPAVLWLIEANHSIGPRGTANWT